MNILSFLIFLYNNRLRVEKGCLCVSFCVEQTQSDGICKLGSTSPDSHRAELSHCDACVRQDRLIETTSKLVFNGN